MFTQFFQYFLTVFGVLLSLTLAGAFIRRVNIIATSSIMQRTIDGYQDMEELRLAQIKSLQDQLAAEKVSQQEQLAARKLELDAERAARKLELEAERTARRLVESARDREEGRVRELSEIVSRQEARITELEAQVHMLQEQNQTNLTA